jgi:hypothetical protein
MPPSESRRPALPADSEPRRCHAFTQFGTQASPGAGLGQQCTFALAWARAARSGAGPRRRGAGTSSVLDSEGPELSSGDQPGTRGGGRAQGPEAGRETREEILGLGLPDPNIREYLRLGSDG